MESIEEWEKLVAKRLIAIEPEDVEEIAKMCATNPAWGAWHAAAVYYGTECPCPDCEGREAPPTGRWPAGG